MQGDEPRPPADPAQPESDIGSVLAAVEADSQSTVTKRLQIPPAQPSAIAVEVKQWARLRERVGSLQKPSAINLLASAASAVGGIGMSAMFAALVLPIGDDTGVDAIVASVLWVVAGACVVLTLALIYLAVLARRAKAAEAGDIVREMDVIESAYDPAPSSSPRDAGT
jgi:hypothetical protein